MAADTSVKVSFIGDAKKLKSTIDDVDKEMGGLGNRAKSFGSKLTDGFQTVLPVLAGVGAGVAVLGSALKAAVEDEAGQKRLAATLTSVAGATVDQIAATEKWIDTTQRATGVADDDLRPALATLVRGTGDLAQAQKLLSLAMDISQGTGKSLADVTEALSKAANDNFKALKALDPALGDLIKDGASTDEIFATLGATFKDQTAVHAGTLEGKLQRVNIAFSEMKESLGYAILPLVTQFGDWMLTTGIPKIEETATKLQDWWAQQDQLKESLTQSAESLKQFGEQTATMTEYAIKLFGAMGPLLQLMVQYQELQNKLNPLNLLNGGGPSVKDLVDANAPKGAAVGGVVGGQWGGGRASGGPVMPGVSYRVGEHGPELLTMGSSGYITPNGGGGGWSGDIVIQIAGTEVGRVLADTLRRQMAGSR